MKREIYGRKVGTQGECKLLISSDGASSGGTKAEKLREFELANTRRAVAMAKALYIAGFDSAVRAEGDCLVRKIDPDFEFDAHREARWAAQPATLVAV